jgi:hypothetical protein
MFFHSDKKNREWRNLIIYLGIQELENVQMSDIVKAIKQKRLKLPEHMYHIGK